MDKRGYRGLVVWQKAIDLVDAVYAATPRFPASDQFGLRSQMERSALSIPSNIAEGYARQSPKEYAKHLRYARGSLAELETQLIVAVRNNRITREDATPMWELTQTIGKMLTSLTSRVAAGAKVKPKTQRPAPNNQQP